MSRLLVALMLVLIGSSAMAETTLRDLDWVELMREGRLLEGEIVTRDGPEVLKVTNPSAKPLDVLGRSFPERPGPEAKWATSRARRSRAGSSCRSFSNTNA